ncbi:MAG: hypothetical protein OQK35_02755 [Alphaproteobacteria bacterium]|nr:hypothetical protein [Alphaproteobacteria bacterium]
MDTSIWMKELETGIPIVDVSKQSLFFLAGRMFEEKVVCGKPGENCRRIEDTILFMSRNLNKEEELMAACGYKNLESHKADHLLLLCKLDEMRDRFVCSSYDNSLVLNFLAGWAVRHTQEHDKPFGRYWVAKNQPGVT